MKWERWIKVAHENKIANQLTFKQGSHAKWSEWAQCVFFFFNLFLLEDNYFIILCWFLPYINMNQPLIYVCPLPVEPLSHFWLHPTPLGCHKALGLSSLCQTANLHWLSHFTFGNVYVSVSGRGSQNFQNDRKWEKDLTSYCWLRRWKGPQAKECG